jgi:hypothetical protein
VNSSLTGEREATAACTLATNSQPSRIGRKKSAATLLAKMCRDLKIDPRDL